MQSSESLGFRTVVVVVVIIIMTCSVVRTVLNLGESGEPDILTK